MITLLRKEEVVFQRHGIKLALCYLQELYYVGAANTRFVGKDGIAL